MTKILSTIIALGLIASTDLYAQCKQAKTPDLVDGTSAQLEELISNQQAVKTYMASANNYLTCLDKEETNAIATGNETEASKTARDAFYDTTVDEMNLIASDFNKEIQKYKAKSAK